MAYLATALALAVAAPPARAMYVNCGATLDYLGRVKDPSRRLVVVGSGGAVTPLGHNVPDTWAGILEGRSGVRRLEILDGLPVQIAGQVRDFRMGPASRYGFLKRTVALSRTHQLATVAAVEAARSAGILVGSPGKWALNHDPERTGVFIGSTQGDVSGVEEGAIELDRQRSAGTRPLAISDPQLALKGIPGMVQGHVAIALQARGPVSCPSAACASGSQSIALAAALILGGAAEVFVSGGADAIITPTGMGARANLRGALSRRNHEPELASRPWDKDRDGFVLGEGAGVLVLTTEQYALDRGYPIEAYLAGWGMTSDANSLTSPSPDGQARAMRLALDMAGLAPWQIGYVHAHGTSTKVGDLAELVGLKRVFGDHVRDLRVSSTKSHMGHLLGASGSVGSIVALQAMLHGLAPATRNLRERGLSDVTDGELTEAELRTFQLVAGEPEPIDVDAVAVNSFGLGGQNVVLVFVRPPRTPH